MKLNKGILSLLLATLFFTNLYSCKEDEEATDWFSPSVYGTDFRADTLELTFYSIYDWELSPRSDWVVPEISSGGPMVPADTLLIFIKANMSREERSTIVDVALLTEGTSARLLTITQEGIPNNIVAATPDVRVPSATNLYTLEVAANIEWETTYFPSWITISDIREVGYDADSEDSLFEIDLAIEENPSAQIRYDKIIFTGVEFSDVECEISVFQDGHSNFQTDSLNLIKLYQSTNGDNWNTSWNLSAPVSEWSGIILDSVDYSGGKEMRVVAINLTNNNLDGEFVNEVFEIAQLKLLWLDKNNLTGVVDDDLFGLKFMQNLRLGDNPLLGGTLSSRISYMTDLISLSIYKTSFIGEIPIELADISTLNFIDLNSNQMSGTLPEALGENRKLKNFIIYNNYFSGEIPSSYLNNINWYDWQPELYIYPQLGAGFTL